MRAVVYESFAGPLTVQEVADPVPSDGGVVIRVQACGICRSDWHGWMGNDPDITLPHVPGHELAGVVEAIGSGVSLWKPGDRVTVPFVGGCGKCPQCQSGNHQVCDHQFQPGFTHWGAFAQYVAINYADTNLVRLSDSLESTTAASLGCRFATSFRGIVAQGQVRADEWVAVHGCGGVGLSAIMIASALGASPVGVDIDEKKLQRATSVGAVATINAAEIEDVPKAILEATSGGAHVSMDALGSPVTCFNSIACLRKRGRHVQVGLMLGDHARSSIPMDRVISAELQILGSHGMQAHAYPDMLQMIEAGTLKPEKLIGKTVTLEESMVELETMDRFPGLGVTVIDRF